MSLFSIGLIALALPVLVAAGFIGFNKGRVATAGTVLAFVLPVILFGLALVWIKISRMGDDDPEGESVLVPLLVLGLVASEILTPAGMAIGFFVRYLREPKRKQPDVF
jgi:hypothetical protein